METDGSLKGSLGRCVARGWRVVSLSSMEKKSQVAFGDQCRMSSVPPDNLTFVLCLLRQRAWQGGQLSTLSAWIW